jgi:hypothetical protein
MSIMETLRNWWRLRYPFHVLGIVSGLLMLWLPYQTFLDENAWADRLRAEGVPARAVVHDLVRKARNSNTMHVRYEVADVLYRAEVACRQVCHPAGTPVQIWVSPDDPGDFVTDFGTLSGHRGRFQGVVGAAGFVLAVSMTGLAAARLSRQRRDRRLRDRKREQREQRQNATSTGRWRKRK